MKFREFPDLAAAQAESRAIMQRIQPVPLEGQVPGTTDFYAIEVDPDTGKAVCGVNADQEKRMTAGERATVVDRGGLSAESRDLVAIEDGELVQGMSKPEFRALVQRLGPEKRKRFREFLDLNDGMRDKEDRDQVGAKPPRDRPPRGGQGGGGGNGVEGRRELR